MFQHRKINSIGNIAVLLILSITQISAVFNFRIQQPKPKTADHYELQANENYHSILDEATSRDIVLIIDTSASMAYETGAEIGGNSYTTSDADDNPKVCNTNNTCEPMASVKSAAMDFIDQLSFPFDRVSIITTTDQAPGAPDGSDYNTLRTAVEVLPLTANKTDVLNAIQNIKVFEPRDCEPWDNAGFVAKPGACLFYTGTIVWDNATRTVTSGTFSHGSYCQVFEITADQWNADPSSCPSNNIGGALKLARNVFIETPATIPDTQLMVVGMFGGAANATDIAVDHPNGYCPENTWQTFPQCRDRYPSVRHALSDPPVTYQNPIEISPGVLPPPQQISLYDADDYARDMADSLATLTSGDGVTIHTIGLGFGVKSTSSVATGEPPAAEDLLQYIAECAGDQCGTTINHGSYFYAQTTNSLAAIFTAIASGPDVPTVTPTATHPATSTGTPTSTPSNTNTPTATTINTPLPATFSDVPSDYWAQSYIERLYNAGITGGCAIGIYCPDHTVTRAQMAVFLLKGIHSASYSPPSVGDNSGFGDVQTDHWAAPWIKQLATEGITSGCGNSNYCPEATVTRAQMAIFLLKARHGQSYSPPPATGLFNDVSLDHWAGKWIEQLAAEGITTGCGNGGYCPDTIVTRAQMAVFLVKAFSLP